MLKKNNRLRKRKEFKYIFRNGKRTFGNYITMLYIPTKLKKYKVGFSVSKKVGNAVIRNKVKRRLREIVKKNKDLLSTKYNYIFVAKKGIEKENFHTIEKDLIKSLKRVEDE